MELPDELTRTLSAAEVNGAAVMLLDSENKILFCNEHCQKIYIATDFSISKTYEDVFWDCVRNNLLGDLEVYKEPEAWLAKALQFKRATSFAQYMVRHKSGRAYLARHQLYPGLGSVFIRMEVAQAPSYGAKWELPDLSILNQSNGSLFSISETADTEIAAALVAHSGVLIDANRKFLETVRESDGICLVGGRLVLSDRIENTKMNAAIAGVTSGKSNSKQILFRVTRKSFGKFYVGSVAAPSWNSWSECFQISGLAAVSFVDPDKNFRMDPSCLQQIFDLTPAEARVAVGIASGKDLSDLAVTYGVSVGTVRNQLKSIFAKTGINKQTEIVRVVTNISRLVRHQDNKN